MLNLIATILTLVAFASSLENDQLLVHTALGAVRGHYKLSYGNRTFAAFEGIPYAKPPVGDLRFAEPQDVEPWTGIWNANKLHTCIQFILQLSEIQGEEDCLYLNVYVPKDKLNSNENMDVLVHIHGGAFMNGSPEQLAGPEFLMDRNIVYVSITYRLGPMGFLSTEDDVVSGNNGLKDHVQALKWVQNNIKYFGGNPESVTITGMSAGGAAVHLHYFSPLSKGLYHNRGIAHSGTALSPWAIQEVPLENARKLAMLVGCSDSATIDFIKCMRQKSVKDILQNVEKFYIFVSSPNTPFAPVIEKASQNAFLIDYPYKMLDNGDVTDVPLIFTITTEEGLMGLFQVNSSLNELNERWNEVLPYVLDYHYTVNTEDKDTVAQKIKEFYFSGKPVTQDNVQSYIKLFGDRFFTLDFERASRMHAKATKSPAFSYIYGYRQDFDLSAAHGLDKYYGVGHGFDNFLIYYMSYIRLGNLSTNDEKIKEMLLDFITSFVKNGKPESKDIKWEAVTNSEDFEYLFIHKVDDIEMTYKKEVAPTEFWNSLPINEYEKYMNGTK